MKHLFYLVVLVIVQISCKPHYPNEGHTRYFTNSILKLKKEDPARLRLCLKEDEVNFFMIADWGGIPYFPYRTFIQQNIANLMNKLTKKMPVHFTLALGDNFYFDGVKNVNDPRFQTTFENVFSAKTLNMPWFIQLGNHDYLGNVSAQLAYFNKSNRWILPDNFYNVDINVNHSTSDENSAKKLIHVMMIDTVLLCGISDTIADFDLDLKGKEKEISDFYFNWIEDELIKISADKVPYIIIAGHYPIYSVSTHGPTYLLIEKLRPLLVKYKVNAYFSGHDHDLEHFSEDSEDNSTTRVHYIVNGAADLMRNDQSNKDAVPEGSLKYYWSSNLNIHGGLCLIRANLKEMIIEFLETSDKLLHKIVILNKWL